MDDHLDHVEEVLHDVVDFYENAEFDPGDIEGIIAIASARLQNTVIVCKALDTLRSSALIASPRRTAIIEFACLTLEHLQDVTLHFKALKVLQVCSEGRGADTIAVNHLCSCVLNLVTLYRGNNSAPMCEALMTLNLCVKAGAYPRVGNDGGVGFFTSLASTLVSMEADFKEPSLQVVVAIYMNIARDSEGTNVRVNAMTIHEHMVRVSVYFLREFGLPSIRPRESPTGPSRMYEPESAVSFVLRDLSDVKYASKKAPFRNETLAREVVQTLLEVLRHKFIHESDVKLPALRALQRLLISEMCLRVAIEEGVGDFFCEVMPKVVLDDAALDYHIVMNAYCEKDVGLCKQILHSMVLGALAFSMVVESRMLFSTTLATYKIIHSSVKGADRVVLAERATPFLFSVFEWDASWEAREMLERLFDDRTQDGNGPSGFRRPIFF